jgi:hypothetical protein
MVWQIVNGCQFDKAMIPLFTRSPFLEIQALAADKIKYQVPILPKLKCKYIFAYNNKYS